MGDDWPFELVIDPEEQWADEVKQDKHAIDCIEFLSKVKMRMRNQWMPEYTEFGNEVTCSFQRVGVLHTKRHTRLALKDSGTDANPGGKTVYSNRKQVSEQICLFIVQSHRKCEGGRK